MVVQSCAANQEPERIIDPTLDFDYSSKIPAIQAAPLFDGLVFFVELRDGRQNRSRCAQKVVLEHGGRVEEKLNKKVTHVIFNGGTRVNYLKAKKLNLPLLSVLWIQESIEAGRCLPLEAHPATCIEDYEKGKFPSLRKLKSITIRGVEEGIAFQEAKEQRKQKRLERIRRKEEERENRLKQFKAEIVPPLYYEGSPYLEDGRKKKEDPTAKIWEEIKSLGPLRTEFFKVGHFKYLFCQLT